MTVIPVLPAAGIGVARDTISGRFSLQAARHGDRAAMVGQGQRVTYRELDEVSNTLARQLIRCGVRPGDVVPVCLPRSVSLVVCLLAVLKAGAAYSVLPPDWPLARRLEIVWQSGAALLVAPSEDGWRTPVFRPPAWEDTTGSPELPEAPRITGEAAAALFFTSGSTGPPRPWCRRTGGRSGCWTIPCSPRSRRE